MTVNIISETIPLLDLIIENGFTLIFDTSFLIWSACFLVLIAYGITQIIENRLRKSREGETHFVDPEGRKYARPFRFGLRMIERLTRPIRSIALSGQILVYLSSIIIVCLVAIGFPLGKSYADHLPVILDMIESDITINSALLVLGIILGLSVSLFPFYWIYHRENQEETEDKGKAPLVLFAIILTGVIAFAFGISFLFEEYSISVQAFEIAFFLYLINLFSVLVYPLARIIVKLLPVEKLEYAGISQSALVIAVIAAILGPFIAVFVMNITAFVVPLVGLTTPEISVWTYSGEFTHIIGPLILLAVLMLVHKLIRWGGRKRGLNFSEVGVIYSTLSISSVFAVLPMWIIRFLVFEFFKGAGSVGGSTGAYIPSVWIPTWPEAINNMVLGGEPTWGYWLLPILFWSLYFISWGVVQLSMNIINRQQWIEVERLNFPVAQAIVESFKAGEIEGLEQKSKVFGFSPFWIGAILGFMLYIPRLLAALSVRNIIPIDFVVPEVLNWLYYDNIENLGTELAQGFFGGSANRVTLNINFALIWIAFAFLIPIDILLGAIIWYVTFYIILPPLQVSLRLYDNPPNQDVGTNYIFVGHRAGAVRDMFSFTIQSLLTIVFILCLLIFLFSIIRNAFRSTKSPTGEEIDVPKSFLTPRMWALIILMLFSFIIGPLNLGGDYIPLSGETFSIGGLFPHFISRGLWLGFPLALVYFQRHYFAQTIKKALNRTKSLEEDDDYRFAYTAIIIGVIILIILNLMSGMGELAFAFPVFFILIYWTWTRVRAETGFMSFFMMFGPWYHEMEALPYIYWHVQGNTNSQQMSTSGIMFIYLSTDRALGSAAQPASMESFKLADMAGVPPRRLYPLQIMAVIFGVILVFPLVIWGTYYFGWTDFKEFSEFDFGLWEGAVGSNVTGDKITGLPPQWQGWIIQFLAGIPIAFLIVWAQQTFLWFPLSVPAIIYGDAAMTGMGLLVPNIIAYLLKVLIFRYGGTRIYEKIAFPLAAGFFIFGLSTFWLSEGIGQHAV
ncbi:MAG: DUF6785 family protein [Candidatus Hodarchaeales archaeon]